MLEAVEILELFAILSVIIKMIAKSTSSTNNGICFLLVIF